MFSFHWFLINNKLLRSELDGQLSLNQLHKNPELVEWSPSLEVDWIIFLSENKLPS